MARVKLSQLRLRSTFFFLTFLFFFPAENRNFCSCSSFHTIMSGSWIQLIDKKKVLIVLDDVGIMDPTYQSTALSYDGSDDEDDDNSGGGGDKNKKKGGDSGDGEGNGDGRDKAEGGDGEEKGMNKDCTGQLGFSYRCTYHAGYENSTFDNGIWK
ncbi:hypothetical protein EZV62_018843 [Acer yangbiense]|uniref:Uncharacterized protein n=1 Tax=Acer yangbiense TaxID=1000413 RepID=A0A5C7H9E7_9ROSI|nr:hypothetical protein EZV62_018843 [Acer yangbiense]